MEKKEVSPEILKVTAVAFFDFIFQLSQLRTSRLALLERAPEKTLMNSRKH